MTPDELRMWRWVHDGMSQQELADHLGVAVLTVKRWEGGTRTPPAFLRLAMERLEDTLFVKA